VVSAVRVTKEALHEVLGVAEEDFELTPQLLNQLLAVAK